MSQDPLQAFLRDLGGLYRARSLYPSGNDQVARAAQRAAESLGRWGRRVRIAAVGEDLLVEDRALTDPPRALRQLLQCVTQAGREGVHLDPGAGADELQAWVDAVTSGEADRWSGVNIRVGSLALEPPKLSGERLGHAAAGYLSLLPQVREVLSDLSREKASGLTRAREIVRAIAAQLATGEELVSPIRDLKAHDDYTFTHALNVCVISAALCRGLGMPPGLVDAVSLAALCHDVGKEKIPPEILNKRGRLDPAEKAVMDRHPIEGAALLLSLPEGVDPLLPVVAYQHHLGADGSGYPPRPSVRAAHPASLLVAVADVYDALRTVRAYQAPRSACAALDVMLDQGHRGALHEGYLGVFARLLGAVGPGAGVTLSDGRRGRVSQARAETPLAPVVGLEEGGEVDLARSPGLRIEHVEEGSLAGDPEASTRD
ncbi:MAG: HD domain-containing protein [Deferrisomatales bacterium]|nr:HD domain-containing protein [Deferrisomatales bacterium]